MRDHSEEHPIMTEPINPSHSDEPNPDESFTWTSDSASPKADAGAPEGAPGAGKPAGATATNIIESFREAVDDLAERATPTVREFSARAAEFAAVAADKAAPLAKRAGEATSDASGKLAAKSRIWASDLRASMTTSDHGSATPAGTPEDVPPAARPAAEPGPSSTEGPGPA
jgi:hypothetical protein